MLHLILLLSFKLTCFWSSPTQIKWFIISASSLMKSSWSYPWWTHSQCVFQFILHVNINVSVSVVSRTKDKRLLNCNKLKLNFIYYTKILLFFFKVNEGAHAPNTIQMWWTDFVFLETSLRHKHYCKKYFNRNNVFHSN